MWRCFGCIESSPAHFQLLGIEQCVCPPAKEAGSHEPIVIRARQGEAGRRNHQVVFSFSTGSPDGKLGARSQQARSANPIETETADDFIFSDATVIYSATIMGLIPLGAPLTT